MRGASLRELVQRRSSSMYNVVGDDEFVMSPGGRRVSIPRCVAGMHSQPAPPQLQPEVESAEFLELQRRSISTHDVKIDSDNALEPPPRALLSEPSSTHDDVGLRI